MSCSQFVCIAYSVIMVEVDCANTESSYSLLTVFPVNTSYDCMQTSDSIILWLTSLQDAYNTFDTYEGDAPLSYIMLFIPYLMVAN